MKYWASREAIPNIFLYLCIRFLLKNKMETEIKYRAKDGRVFDDPFKCEDYENSLGISPGTIADVLQYLEKEPEEKHVSGIIICKHEGVLCSTTFNNIPIKEYLKDDIYSEEKCKELGWISSSVKDVIKEIRRSYDDNDLCQITFLIGETRYMKNCIPVTTYNSKLWNPDKELFIFDNMHNFPSNFRK